MECNPLTMRCYYGHGIPQGASINYVLMYTQEHMGKVLLEHCACVKEEGALAYDTQNYSVK